MDPILEKAVEDANAEYETIRAPFFRPRAVKSLGSIDEHSEIKCIADGLAGMSAGSRYPIEPRISATTYMAKRTNDKGGKDDVTLSGRELVIDITSKTPEKGFIHSFN